MALARIELDVMLAHREHFITMISGSCALSNQTLAKHERLLDWQALSGNQALEWSAELVEAHIDHWWRTPLFGALTHVALDRRSPEPLVLLAKFSEWHTPQSIEARFYTQARVETILAQGDSFDTNLGVWPNDAACWIAEVFDRGPRDRWAELAGCSSFPWTEALIEQRADLLDWTALSCNDVLPWSLDFVRRHDARWDWTNLIRLDWAGETDARLGALLQLAGERVDWAKLLGSWQMTWTAHHFERLRGRMERVAGQAEPSSWPFFPRDDWMTFHWTPDFVDRLVELEAELGHAIIDWSMLSERGGQRLWTAELFDRYHHRIDLGALAKNKHAAALLDTDTIEAFLTACSTDLSVQLDAPRHPGFEAIIAADPADPAGYDVYADWLDEHRDPHAALIRTMRGVERGVVTAATADEAAARCAGQLGVNHRLVWRHGFVRKAAWFRRLERTPWLALLAQRHFALVEELRIADGIPIVFGCTPGYIADAAWTRLAQLPALTKLALHHVELGACSAAHVLPRLTHLDLTLSWVRDLSALTNFPQLRSLWLSVDGDFVPTSQLEALAAMPKLEMLGLCGSGDDPEHLLDILGRCKHLHTVEFTEPFMNPDAIAHLPRVRWLFIPEVFRDEAEYSELTINGDTERPWVIHECGRGGGEQWAQAPDAFTPDW